MSIFETLSSLHLAAHVIVRAAAGQLSSTFPRYSVSFQTIKTVSFDGSGFLEVDSHGIRSNSSVGFTFRTGHDSGLILFSGSSDNDDFYSVSMSQGSLVFAFGRGGFSPMQFR